ncbi:PREDICTED: alpha-tocopherol transfer protein-like [Nicrophorus vespilloides]|uniref:Alpha-tocopherol transfer protein-like n=1 Tax=Nicrophorus vespilloides TaxID=110193 RepID=A0ABM1MG61_NICVS|nr:PREDICTED: alpha-tocopherol transfer protein-like [Nicrophorus vespilloides]
MGAIDLKSVTPLLQYTDDDVSKVLAAYNRKANSLDEDVNTIKEWFKTQTHIPVQPSDRQIVSFLIMNKFSIERTKEKLELNYSIKNMIPEYYNSKVNLNTKACTLVTLPQLTENKNRVYVFTFLDDKHFNLASVITDLINTFELRTLADVCESEEYIIDYSNITVSTVAKMNPMDLKKLSTVLEKVYSNRVAGLHAVMLPSFAEAIFNVLKACLKPKIRERIVFHKNYESLLKYFPAEILPKEFGGTGKSISDLKGEWENYLEQNKEHIANMHSVRVNEKLRPTSLQNHDILGFHGNFRKLEVD